MKALAKRKFNSMQAWKNAGQAENPVVWIERKEKGRDARWGVAAFAVLLMVGS
jgi:hypothetical protein